MSWYVSSDPWIISFRRTTTRGTGLKTMNPTTPVFNFSIPGTLDVRPKLKVNLVCDWFIVIRSIN